MRAGLVSVLTAGAMTLAACGGGGDSGGDGSSDASNCEGLPAHGLSPRGNGPEAFTMIVRVNQASDIAAIESSLADYIEPRDLFMVNTEFARATPSGSEQLVEELADKYPCNRIVSLNGLKRDPNRPSYAYALAGHPDVHSVVLDWEPDTYEAAGKGEWTPEPGRNLVRIGEELELLGERVKSTKARIGVVPDYLPPWDYAQVHRVVARKNLEVEPTHFGYQIVQTQPVCGERAASIGQLAADLVKQYRPLLAPQAEPEAPPQSIGGRLSPVLLQHLGFEVAFDTDPNPKSTLAVERVGPEEAAECSAAVLRDGGGAILYWAAPESIKAMLETPVGKRLRQPSSGS